MLQPKRLKYRRPHIVRYEGVATKGNTVAFGEFGLEALEGTWISARQIEAARIVLSRYTKRSGKVYIRIFPQLAKTKKPAEVRMGSGKGSPEYYVAVVKKGTIMFEMAGVSEADARQALKLASYKLPIKCRVVSKADTVKESK
ncbi:MAG: 50S ribosomal protein L16 [Firmicutes bacterium]|nr:50S ribosomal protein L16 [Candidatus Alectryobacillus merdavium]